MLVKKKVVPHLSFQQTWYNALTQVRNKKAPGLDNGDTHPQHRCPQEGIFFPCTHQHFMVLLPLLLVHLLTVCSLFRTKRLGSLFFINRSYLCGCSSGRKNVIYCTNLFQCYTVNLLVHCDQCWGQLRSPVSGCI